MAFSKTKLGAGLLGLAAVFTTLGGAFTGTIDWSTAVSHLVAEIGAVITAFGIRDWPIWNKVK